MRSASTSFILCTKNCDWKAAIYRECGRKHEMDGEDNIYYTLTWIIRIWSCLSGFLESSTQRHRRETRCPQTALDFSVDLTWQLMMDGHFISGVPLGPLWGKAQQWQGGRASLLRVGGWPGCLARGGRCDPTLWEALRPRPGEPQDLLHSTGLRGGLPNTNTSLFRSACKSHRR